MDTRQKYNQRVAQMKALRQRHETKWQDIADFIAPDSYEDPNTQPTNDGERRDSAIVNNTPTLALEVAVSGLFNGTCDPTERWIDLEAADPELNKNHAVRKYCDDCVDRVLNELARSNFYKLVSEDFRSLLAFGTCATVMVERFGGDAIVTFQSQPIGSYHVAQSFEREINEFVRDLRMTANQMVEKFTEERVSQPVKEAYRSQRGQQEFAVVHLIHQNPSHNPMADALSADKQWLSCYYEPNHETKNDQMLDKSGFETFPIACARWSTTGANPWGFGCGRTAIGDSRALMAMEVDSATAVELQVRPPLLAPPGVEVSLIPGQITYGIDDKGTAQVVPLMNVQHDLSHSTQKINEHEERIGRAFFNDIFLMIANDEGGEMTAREIIERAREKRLALTPILRVIEEYHKPIIRFLFTLCGRRGRLPAPPPELEGQELRIVPKSVLAQAAELERATAARSAVANVTQVGQFVPKVLDIPDWDKVIREDFRRTGVATDLVLSPEDVDQIRAAQAEAMQKKQQGEAANLAANTAKTLSETDTSASNALTNIMAGLQQ